MKGLRGPFRSLDDDPGPAWVEDLLAPLRGERIACDVAPRIMRRIASEPAGGRPLPFAGGTSRLALAGSLLVGFAAFVFLLSVLLMMVAGGDEGVRLLGTMLEPAGRLAGMGAHYLYRFAVAVGAAALAILRGAWVVAEAASPLIRGAGLFAAAGGLLSIVVSTCLFAQARRTASVAGRRGDEAHSGGSR